MFSQFFDEQKANTFVENRSHDYDQDGFTEEEGDCNDLNEAQNPSQSESFAMASTTTATGLSTISRSTFKIGMRMPMAMVLALKNSKVLACELSKPDGYVEAKLRGGEGAFDCDDSEVNVNPDGIEQCDLLDNDCDGIVDNYEGPDAPVWYADTDGDGFGSIHYPETKCEDENGDGPPGYVEKLQRLRRQPRRKPSVRGRR